jgi:hypothetical protein
MFEDTITDDIKAKYTVLPLDTFYFASIDQQRTAFCLIETVPIAEMTGMDRNIELHANLIRNYCLRNWNYCVDAIEHLKGRWNGELDSFYSSLLERIAQYREVELDPAWTGVIIRN